jgi:hypothetical protein
MNVALAIPILPASAPTATLRAAGSYRPVVPLSGAVQFFWLSTRRSWVEVMPGEFAPRRRTQSLTIPRPIAAIRTALAKFCSEMGFAEKLGHTSLMSIIMVIGSTGDSTKP